MSENIMDELCKGCISYERVNTLMSNFPQITYEDCLGYIIKDINCPCIRCLIKPICDVVCDDFLNRKWVF